MSAAAAAGHSSPPPTSAAVLEFICLFSHDLRRKQKRWQDGRLKYHTFNNRVMVYDDRGNFVGDMHWRHDWDLAEGEEVQLERGGVIVQVQELSSRCEQDLSELLAKRAKDKGKRQMQAVARSPAPSALSRTAVRPAMTRPLHRVIGTPSGHHGRALVPKESPYEQRQQASESPDQPAAKRRKYDPPAPSKSGYASALFGQTLTLSATPMSSMPAARRQPIEEPDSSQENEVSTTRPVQEDPKPPLREQSKLSRHFNQPGERQEPIKAAKNLTEKHRNVDDDDKMIGRKDERSLPRKDRTDKSREPNSVDVEVIDVDNLNTSEIPKSARPAIEKTGTAQQSKIRKKTNTKSTLSSSRHNPDTVSNEDERIDDLPSQDVEDTQTSKTNSIAEKLKNSRTKITKTLGKSALAKSSAKKHSHHPDATVFSPRDSNVPVTELRIKPRKKRGLMMMSDLHQATREHADVKSGVFDAASAAAQAREAEETDCSFRSLPSVRRTDLYGAAGSRIYKSRNQHAASTELGKPEQSLPFSSPDADVMSSFKVSDLDSKLPTRDDGTTQAPEDEDLFRSPTPPCAQLEEIGKRDSETAIRPFSSKRSRVAANSIRQSSSEPTEPAQSTTNRLTHHQTQNVDCMSAVQAESGCVFQLKDDNLITASVDNALSPVNQLSPLLPQARDHDPYRWPSSSPEELVQLPTCVTSNATATNATSVSRARSLISPEDLDTLQSADTGKKINDEERVPKRQRAFLRNVVLDEDDELDVRSDAHVSAGNDMIETLSIGSSDTNAKTSQKKRRLKQENKHNSKVAETLDGNGSRLDLSEAPSKKQAKPKHTRSTTKTKALPQERELDSDPEDALPVKHRRTNRNTRAQSTEPNETSLPSEQEDSEEGLSSKGYRRKKPRTSSNRPRLEKVKKSVKSRELIGFNLSVLNAPLGLRGIGMPFSILSSPANESIQRKIDTHAALEPSSESLFAALEEELPVPTPDALQTIAKADEVAVDVQTLEVDGGAPSPQSMPVSMVPRKPDRNNRAEEPSGIPTPEMEQQPTVVGPVEVISSTLRRQSFTVSKGARLASGKPEDLAEKVMDKDTLLSNNTTVVDPKIKQLRKVPTRHHQTTSSVPMIEEVPKKNGVERMIEAEHAVERSLPACKMPASKPNATLQVQELRTASIDLDLGGQDHDGEHEAQTNPATVSSLPAFKRPTPKPALPQQASCTVNMNLEVKSQDHGNEETAAADEAMGCSEKSTGKMLLAGARRQAPSFKPPTRAQNNIAHIDNESEAESIHRGANTAETEPDGLESSRFTHMLSRSNSETMQPKEAKTAADSSDTRGSTLPNSELALPEGRQPRVSLQRTVSVTRRINNINIKPPQAPTINDPTPAESSTKPAPNARIANPASRGRKAAVKSDAKGPVPQRMLPPTQPFAMGPISTADFALTPIEGPPKEPERPKKKMTFPGFQSAKDDGPWSREAFDLLESGRPG